MPVSSSIKLTPLARETLLSMVWDVLVNAINGKGLKMPQAPVIDQLLEPAACFVTLQRQGQLRGCIGTLTASEPLWINACKNVYASAFRDNRFEPLAADELTELSLEISVLSELIPMENEGEARLMQTLRPGVDGLLLEEGYRRAVFLPTVWESLPSPELFINALKRKGGWREDYWSRDIELHTFTTEVIADR